MRVHITRGVIRVLPKIDHSGIDARIVLEQNKFSPRVEGSIPVRGIFFAEFILNTLIQFCHGCQNDLY